MVGEKVFAVNHSGFSTYKWDVKINALKKNKKRNVNEWIFAEKGTYDLTFANGGISETVKVEIK